MLPLSGAAGATYSKTICFCNNSTLAPDPSTPPSTGLPRHSHPPPFLQCSAPPCVVPPFCSVPNRISLVWSRLSSNPPPLTAQVLSISVHSSTNEFSRHLVQRMWWSLYLLRCNSVRVPAIIQPAITSVPEQAPAGPRPVSLRATKPSIIDIHATMHGLFHTQNWS
ncbi:hypothetical protein PVAP13_3KG562100 [Panicum virgatum]|uniref:Uncharacterized protein n=1 Tax=Panicum virgatum TaxID=38727 RepID=A0A8T0VGV7_PANVG|nr:hypothetical protein PVAP13_3KG562100 [Panicum virgatum]